MQSDSPGSSQSVLWCLWCQQTDIRWKSRQWNRAGARGIVLIYAREFQFTRCISLRLVIWNRWSFRTHVILGWTVLLETLTFRKSLKIKDQSPRPKIKDQLQSCSCWPSLWPSRCSSLSLCWDARGSCGNRSSRTRWRLVGAIIFAGVLWSNFCPHEIIPRRLLVKYKYHETHSNFLPKFTSPFFKIVHTFIIIFF